LQILGRSYSLKIMLLCTITEVSHSRTLKNNKLSIWRHHNLPWIYSGRVHEAWTAWQTFRSTLYYNIANKPPNAICRWNFVHYSEVSAVREGVRVVESFCSRLQENAPRYPMRLYLKPKYMPWALDIWRDPEPISHMRIKRPEIKVYHVVRFERIDCTAKSILWYRNKTNIKWISSKYAFYEIGKYLRTYQI